MHSCDFIPPELEVSVMHIAGDERAELREAVHLALTSVGAIGNYHFEVNNIAQLYIFF